GHAADGELLQAADKDELGPFLSTVDIGNHTRATEVITAVADGIVTSHEREETVCTLKGSPKNVVVKSTVVTDDDPTRSRLVVALVDVTERKRAEERLRASEERFRELSLRDDLTGLFNTRYLYQALEELLAASAAKGDCFSLIFMDLDRFKNIVDTYGHLDGSRVIREVGETIRETLSASAFAVAYAGDEFVMVLPAADKRSACAKAEEIRVRLAEKVYLATSGLAVRL